MQKSFLICLLEDFEFECSFGFDELDLIVLSISSIFLIVFDQRKFVFDKYKCFFFWFYFYSFKKKMVMCVNILNFLVLEMVYRKYVKVKELIFRKQVGQFKVDKMLKCDFLNI